MEIPPLIYCASGNARFAKIAVDAGWLYGCQFPGAAHPEVAPIWFADQDWKKPDRTKYMAALKKYRPARATVLDLERDNQIDEVLDWAQEAAQWVQSVVIIPKVCGIIDRIPEQVSGVDVVLGYSVPTRYGGTFVPVWEFGNRPVHLLGGSPQAQMKLCHYLNVVSADGSMASRMATTRCQFWTNGNGTVGNDRYWPNLTGWGKDAPDEAFRRSCVNIMAAWRKIW